MRPAELCPGCVLTRAPVPRATGEDRERPGHHSRRDADSREGAEGDGTLLWHLPQVLEKVSLFQPFNLDVLISLPLCIAFKILLCVRAAINILKIVNFFH
jgi:hypothetical protein